MSGDYLLVEMDLSHNKIFKVGDVELIRPDDWLHEESINEGRKFATNVDMRDINPQIATVIIPNDNSFLNAGDRIFVHFNCILNGKPVPYNGKEYLAIQLWQVYFVIKGVNEYRMMPKTYLGEQVYTEARTQSGIYLTPTGQKKEVLQVKITHIPEEDRQCRVGDVVMSMDEYHFTLKLDGREYIKMRDYEITGVVGSPGKIEMNMSRPTKVY